MESKQKRAGRPVGSNAGAAPAFTRKQLKVVLAVAATTKKAKMNVAFLQLLLCSLRCSEVVHLTIGDLLNENGEVVETFGLAGMHTKSKRSRMVFLSRSCREAMSEYIHTLPQAATTKLFPFSANYSSFLASKLCSEAGFPNHTAHSFRRTCATLLQEECPNLKIQQLQLLLGHASCNTTLLYVNRSPAPLQEAFRDLRF